MDYAQQRSNPTRHIIGLGLVVLLHVFLIWALINGLGSAVIDVIRAPIATKIIREVPPPPPLIQVQQPPPPHAIQTVTHAAPPPNTPPQVYRPAPAAPPGPPDHSAGSRPINNVQLEYPEDMQDAQRQGRVSISCTIDADGDTSDCRVLSSQGGGSFVRSALDYVHRARYVPAVRNGQKVTETNHVLNITFAMSGGGDGDD